MKTSVHEARRKGKDLSLPVTVQDDVSFTPFVKEYSIDVPSVPVPTDLPVSVWRFVVHSGCP